MKKINQVRFKTDESIIQEKDGTHDSNVYNNSTKTNKIFKSQLGEKRDTLKKKFTPVEDDSNQLLSFIKKIKDTEQGIEDERNSTVLFSKLVFHDLILAIITLISNDHLKQVLVHL